MGAFNSINFKCTFVCHGRLVAEMELFARSKAYISGQEHATNSTGTLLNQLLLQSCGNIICRKEIIHYIIYVIVIGTFYRKYTT